MAKWRCAILLVVALFALAPSLAEARAGGHFSGGGMSYMSRGSRGFGSASQSPAATAPGYGNYHPFLTGLFGGFFGGMIGSMLFHGMGSIYLWFILLWLGWMGYRAMAGHFSAQRPPGGAMRLGGFGPGLGAMPFAAGAAAPRPAVAPLAISGADYQAFETILKGVQAAWSDGDLQTLRRYATPEMQTHFTQDLSDNQRQGVVNKVEQIELLKGDLREAWDEGQTHYATCLLHWRAYDYTVRIGAQMGDMSAVVAGDPRQPAEAAELWTFARSPGGTWLLSAIQQI
jgi:predicted lipid-binding transport protein (Tim44 family)